MKITGLFIYPVKSLGAVPLEESEIGIRGLFYDRQWMLVKPDGSMITQREFPEMALFKIENLPEHFQIRPTHKTQSPLLLEKNGGESGEKLSVKIWNDTAEALCMNPVYDEWFSEILETNCRLVKMPPDGTRKHIFEKFGEKNDLNFPDSKPLLITNELSLEALNGRAKYPVPMDRFRPNIVFRGLNAFEEDGWNEFGIGENRFKMIKPCGRCIITTIDQQTAEKGKEPLKTLKTFRLENNNTLFGMYARFVPAAGAHSAHIRRGDKIAEFDTK